MKSLPPAALLLTAALGLSGCAKARAATQPDLAALSPPPAPPRVVVPPEPEPETPPAAAVQAPEGIAKPPVRRPQPRPEPTKVEPPKPVVTPPAKEEPAPPATLQTMPPGGQLQMRRETNDLLAQASRDLDQVKAKYSSLSADAKAQYDTARNFAAQAQQALKEQNYAFARRLADKAATLAGGLVGR